MRPRKNGRGQDWYHLTCQDRPTTRTVHTSNLSMDAVSPTKPIQAVAVATTPSDDGDVCGGNYYNGVLGDSITEQDCQLLLEQLEKRHAEREARMARERREDLRRQTNELVLDSSKKTAMVMEAVGHNANSLEGLRSDLQVFTQASTEAMRYHRNGEVMVQLRDSTIKNKKQHDEIKRLKSEVAGLKAQIAAGGGDGGGGGDGDAAFGDSNDGFNDCGIALCDKFDAVASSSAADDDVGGGGSGGDDDVDVDDDLSGFAYSSIQQGDPCDVFDRRKAAEEEDVRRKKLARQDRDVLEHTKKSLPGAPTSFPHVRARIDTGSHGASAAAANTLSSDVPIATKVRVATSGKKKNGLRPPICPMSTTKTRSSTKRVAATVDASPSEGPHRKRTRRSSRSTGTLK